MTFILLLGSESSRRIRPGLYYLRQSVFDPEKVDKSQQTLRFYGHMPERYSEGLLGKHFNI